LSAILLRLALGQGTAAFCSLFPFTGGYDMDLDETLRELLEALKRRRWNDVEASAENLLGWLHKRGWARAASNA
jgi:hypothetical protein